MERILPMVSIILTAVLIFSGFRTPLSTATPTENTNSLALDKLLANTAAIESQSSTGIVSGGIYNIKNNDTGKSLNVHYGVDADGTNEYQWSYDGSMEQKLKVVYRSSTQSDLLYAMCSSSGNNRAIDVSNQGPLLAGSYGWRNYHRCWLHCSLKLFCQGNPLLQVVMQQRPVVLPKLTVSFLPRSQSQKFQFGKPKSMILT